MPKGNIIDLKENEAEFNNLMIKKSNYENNYGTRYEFNTQEKITILFSNFSKMLKQKNKNYGDSALNPVRIFSKVDAANSILIRLDDKMNRVINGLNNGEELRKNDICDIMGYLSLYMISKDWLDFEEQID